MLPVVVSFSRESIELLTLPDVAYRIWPPAAELRAKLPPAKSVASVVLVLTLGELPRGVG